jgi:oligoribonuclease
MTESNLPGPYSETQIIDPDVTPEMVWVDLETTGLNAQQNIPLEIGILVTDKWGKEHSAARSLILEPEWDLHLARAVPFVQDMHEKNGLASQLRRTNSLSPDATEWLCASEVDKWMLDFLNNQAGPAGKMEMSGSTINFDRAFLDRHLPLTHGWFHYRNVDVSSVRNLCKLHNRPVYDARMKQLEGFEAKHRVLDDIRASVDEYKFYVDNFIFTEND